MIPGLKALFWASLGHHYQNRPSLANLKTHPIFTTPAEGQKPIFAHYWGVAAKKRYRVLGTPIDLGWGSGQKKRESTMARIGG